MFILFCSLKIWDCSLLDIFIKILYRYFEFEFCVACFVFVKCCRYGDLFGTVD